MKKNKQNEEQQGEYRAQYGKQVLKNLSERLTERFGDGWSYPSMKNIRQFYLIYSKRLDTVYPIDTPKAKHCLANSEPRFTLSWSSYLVLMRIDNPDERSFYEIECAKQQWSVRQLQRQVASSLYERLALSRDKAEVMRLSVTGDCPDCPLSQAWRMELLLNNVYFPTSSALFSERFCNFVASYGSKRSKDIRAARGGSRWR